jgi:hypothetical protein
MQSAALLGALRKIDALHEAARSLAGNFNWQQGRNALVTCTAAGKTAASDGRRPLATAGCPGPAAAECTGPAAAEYTSSAAAEYTAQNDCSDVPALI